METTIDSKDRQETVPPSWDDPKRQYNDNEMIIETGLYEAERIKDEQELNHLLTGIVLRLLSFMRPLNKTLWEERREEWKLITTHTTDTTETATERGEAYYIKDAGVPGVKFIATTETMSKEVKEMYSLHDKADNPKLADLISVLLADMREFGWFPAGGNLVTSTYLDWVRKYMSHKNDEMEMDSLKKLGIRI